MHRWCLTKSTNVRRTMNSKRRLTSLILGLAVLVACGGGASSEGGGAGGGTEAGPGGPDAGVVDTGAACTPGADGMRLIRTRPAVSAVVTELRASSVAPAACADALNWSEPSSQFDNGSAPVVVLGTRGLSNGPSWEVEVHQGGPDTLWYSWGWASETMPIALGGASQFASGYAGAVASVGSSPGTPIVLEVNQLDSGVGPLLAHLIWTTGPVTTTPSFTVGRGLQYDTGFAPAVAGVPTGSSTSMVVEVHQTGPGVGPLWLFSSRPRAA